MNEFSILEIPAGDKVISNEKLSFQEALQTAPPTAAKNPNVVTVNTEFDCMSCCCSYAQGETVSSSKNHTNTNASNLTKKTFNACLSSACYYMLVIIFTLFCSFLIIIEVLLDTDVLEVTTDASLDSSTAVPGGNHATSHLSTVLHWISFTILALFTFETLARVYLWRIEILRNPISLSDAAIVICSFVVNLTTSLAVGTQSPWDAISLIIVFRCIRIYSLLSSKKELMKRNYLNNVEVLQIDLSNALLNNVKLQKQIKDKDFEIKQYISHLSGGSLTNDEELKSVMETSKKTQATSDYQKQLEKAIEMSKTEYKQTGVTNRAFQEYSSDVIVHHSEEDYKNLNNDQPGPSNHLKAYNKLQDDSFSEENEKLMLFKNSQNNNNNSTVQCVLSQTDEAKGSLSAPRKSGKLVKLQPQKQPINAQSRWKTRNPDYSDISSDDEGIGSASTSMENSLPASHLVSINISEDSSKTNEAEKSTEGVNIPVSTSTTSV